MKITLDYNCIINLENKTEIGEKIEEILADKGNECFVVNIGASEMREMGIFPDRHDLFEELLKSTNIDHLPKLNPMGIFDVTFFDACILADDEMVKLSTDIEDILFPNKLDIDIEAEGIDSPAGRKWLNRLCDVHSMWCHIYNKNEVFLTSDTNFTKETKLPKLINLGAGRVCCPRDF